MRAIGLAVMLLVGGTWMDARAALPANQQDVATPSFHGRLYRAASPKPVVVLLLGGSEGHLYAADELAPAFNAAGYTVLGIDYHAGYDPGHKLDLVPIENFTSAVSWLRALPEHPAVAVIGESRGSEAALLTGIYDHDVAGVAAFVTSSALWGATDNDAQRHNAAWTWAGKSLACANCAMDAGTFDASLDKLGKDSVARIEVEKIQAPLFLAGSDADAVWPSGRMTRELAARLAEKHFAYPVVVMTFPASSHRLLGRGPSKTEETYAFGGQSYTSHYGGTEEGTAAAREASWAGLMAFLGTLK